MAKHIVVSVFAALFLLFPAISAEGAVHISRQGKDSVSISREGTDSVYISRASGDSLSPGRLLREGDSLRLRYEFKASLDRYDQALEAETDSLKAFGIEDRILLSENGYNMLDFVYRPEVVARQKFSIEDFFLYYPMQDKAWRQVPNQLDTVGRHPFAKAVYVPSEAGEIYYSASDENEVRNIWRTVRGDSLWTVPTLLNEQLTSTSDEIYPMLSEDGKTLYFASEGLYGMGGYDLYMSHWNEESEDWGTPVNMGFPYSSPYDDMLYYDSPDGGYSVFASNRDCSPDSIYVYVLQYDSMPIHSRVETVEELRELMRLEPSANVHEDEPAGVPENEGTRRYSEKMTEVRALRDSIYRYGVLLEEARTRFAMSDDVEERSLLSEQIMRMETGIPMLRDSLSRASAVLLEIEMDFLSSGVVFDPGRMEVSPSGNADAEARYEFVRNSFGPALDLQIEAAEPDFDYSFMILPEGRFAKDNTLPQGIVYQIQIFSTVRQASVADLRGLSPVFERMSSAGRYSYSVGLFRTYNDVLSHLNRVRRAGFKSAFIVAFRDGTPIPVETARKLE